MWNKIINPINGKYVSVNDNLGKKILKNYIYHLTGGADAPAYGEREVYDLDRIKNLEKDETIEPLMEETEEQREINRQKAQACVQDDDHCDDNALCVNESCVVPAKQTIKILQPVIPTLGDDTQPPVIPTLGDDTQPPVIPTLGDNTQPPVIPTLGDDTQPPVIPTQSDGPKPGPDDDDGGSQTDDDDYSDEDFYDDDDEDEDDPGPDNDGTKPGQDSQPGPRPVSGPGPGPGTNPDLDDDGSIPGPPPPPSDKPTCDINNIKYKLNITCDGKCLVNIGDDTKPMPPKFSGLLGQIKNVLERAAPGGDGKETRLEQLFKQGCAAAVLDIPDDADLGLLHARERRVHPLRSQEIIDKMHGLGHDKMTPVDTTGAPELPAAPAHQIAAAAEEADDEIQQDAETASQQREADAERQTAVDKAAEEAAKQKKIEELKEQIGGAQQKLRDFLNNLNLKYKTVKRAGVTNEPNMTCNVDITKFYDEKRTPKKEYGDIPGFSDQLLQKYKEYFKKAKTEYGEKPKYKEFFTNVEQKLKNVTENIPVRQDLFDQYINEFDNTKRSSTQNLLSQNINIMSNNVTALTEYLTKLNSKQQALEKLKTDYSLNTNQVATCFLELLMFSGDKYSHSSDTNWSKTSIMDAIKNIKDENGQIEPSYYDEESDKTHELIYIAHYT